jgi:23S rRNA (cytidine2498-2'-O)-methyltransferase
MAEQRFGFAVVNVGSENALKAEIARLVPGARPAFARPGLVTFKHDAADAGFAADSIVARVRGLSLGIAKSADEVLERVDAHGKGPFVLHVFARDATDEGPTEADAARAVELDRELREKGGERFVDRVVPAVGERVIDVVVAGDEPMLVGVHQHRRDYWTTPGGRPAGPTPTNVPSRGYRKLEEALAWSGLELAPGSSAVELGAAPGGAALALAQRGVNVNAIDPAAMSEDVLAFVGPGGARVRHIKKPGGGVDLNDVPKGTSLLLLDVSLAPPMALRYFGRLASLAQTASVAIVTLKLGEAKTLDDVPRAFEVLRSLGFGELRATRLPSNRSEICIVARRSTKPKTAGKPPVRGPASAKARPTGRGAPGGGASRAPRTR